MLVFVLVVCLSLLQNSRLELLMSYRSQVYSLSWGSPNKKKRHIVAITLPRAWRKSSFPGPRGLSSCPLYLHWQPYLDPSKPNQMAKNLKPVSSPQPSFPDLDPACWQESWKVRSISRIPIYFLAKFCLPCWTDIDDPWVIAFIYRKESGWKYTEALIIIISGW